ncbi:V-type ATP synthase subunit I [Arhodomonas sp. AD133]|uniref:V-type ATP synthase subunit I n=1 Tax=Arhodomonas sp. AD133 TaxID=3415009 RepID=UPI003EB82AAA
MTIVALRRVTLFGASGDKESVLAGLQSLGVMHLVALRPAEEADGAGAGSTTTRNALKYLLDCPVKRHQVPDDPDFDLQATVERALENRRRTRELEDTADFLRRRIADLAPWGDFHFPPLDSLAGFRLWFYEVPNYKRRHLADVTLPWQEVHRDNRNSYIAVLARDEPAADAMPVPRTHTGSVPRSALEQRLQRVGVNLDELAAEREALTRWIHLIHRHLARAEDAANLEAARHVTLDDEAVFAVQGWVPVPALEAVASFARQRGLAFLDEPVTDESDPPTLLSNDEATAGGEELVRFYQVPGYRSWDPSRVIFFSFAAFFAMILADAGYAAVLAVIIAFASPRLVRLDHGGRLRNLGYALAVFSGVYGVLVGSYFGWSPPAGSLLGALQVLDIHDFGQMMYLAVGVGLAHLLVANAIVAWHRRGRAEALAPLGWMVALVAGALLYLDVPGGGPALAAGLAGVAVFTDTRPVHRPMDLLRRAAGGLLGLTNVTKAFGDVLSYLRLFALGLASASLAVTFNQLATDAAAVFPGVGLLLHVVILVAGHALNFVLAVVSGVVHGLRLNVIEFYNWGISDEGYPFRPFATTEREPWKS